MTTRALAFAIALAAASTGYATAFMEVVWTDTPNTSPLALASLGTNTIVAAPGDVVTAELRVVADALGLSAVALQATLGRRVSLAAVPLLLCACAVAGLLVAEARGSQRGIWLTKPVAAAAFLWAAISWGALDSDYGLQVLAGLALCACGDVLLIPRGRSLWFQLGIGAFLLGHVAYALAFAGLGLDRVAGGLAVLGLVLFAWRVLVWLGPHVPADFRLPVRAYVAVISAMVVTAIAATADGQSALIAIGAIGFALSDLSVARQRFVQPGFVNAAWGLPLYFGAQLLIAASVGG